MQPLYHYTLTRGPTAEYCVPFLVGAYKKYCCGAYFGKFNMIGSYWNNGSQEKDGNGTAVLGGLSYPSHYARWVWREDMTCQDEIIT